MSAKVTVLFDKPEEAYQLIRDGQLLPILIDGRPYGLARKGSSLFVFDRACPHAGYDLTTGKLSPAGTIVCPWHNYQFHLYTGKELTERCKALQIQPAFLNEKGQVCYRPTS